MARPRGVVLTAPPITLEETARRSGVSKKRTRELVQMAKEIVAHLAEKDAAAEKAAKAKRAKKSALAKRARKTAAKKQSS